VATIIKDWCPVCKGAGHVPGCHCSTDEEFVIGCCEKCGAEGMITIGTCYCGEVDLIGQCPVHGLSATKSSDKVAP